MSDQEAGAQRKSHSIGDEKWLDELISSNIDTSEPKFDAEQWKKKYPGQFQTLIERGSRRSAAGRFPILSAVFSRRVAQLAAAAVIIVGISLLIAYLGPGEQVQAAESPAQMVTAMSLRMAYRHGGMEALEKQCDDAVRLLGPARPSPSVADLVGDLNG